MMELEKRIKALIKEIEKKLNSPVTLELEYLPGMNKPNFLFDHSFFGMEDRYFRIVPTEGIAEPHKSRITDFEGKKYSWYKERDLFLTNLNQAVDDKSGKYEWVNNTIIFHSAEEKGQINLPLSTVPVRDRVQVASIEYDLLD